MPLAHVVKSIRAAAATRARQARSVARPIDRVILGFEWHGNSSRRAALSVRIAAFAAAGVGQAGVAADGLERGHWSFSSCISITMVATERSEAKRLPWN